MLEMEYLIRENSWIARLAALKLRTQRVAIVLGKTIHLYHTSTEEFLQDRKWVKHELCHIRQFQRYGYMDFVVKYLWESIRHGYYNNRFERAARAAGEVEE